MTLAREMLRWDPQHLKISAPTMNIEIFAEDTCFLPSKFEALKCGGTLVDDRLQMMQRQLQGLDSKLLSCRRRCFDDHLDIKQE